jgi:replicative DNA helicase
MEKNSYNVYPQAYRNTQTPADEIEEYINKRRKRVSKSLKTRWKKFNSLCMGGIEPNVIYTIAGISGSGKSSFVGSLEVDLFDLNPDVDFVILNFSYEMIDSRIIGRKLSYRLNKTTSELYSGGDKTLDDKSFTEVQKELERIRQLPIYYVDMPGNVEQMRQTILKFKEREGKGKWVIIVLDHTLLTKGTKGEDERVTLANLERMFIEVKKYELTTIIQLSQMNRNIESVDRIANKSMHYPMRTDLFGSDMVMQSSDYVLILHKPSALGIAVYGPRNRPTEGIVYLHVLKNRDGEAGVIIPYEDNLKYNRLDEIDLKELLAEKEQSDNKINFEF